MPTYRTSARNQFRTPLGAVGDPPDVPGYLSTFSDDLDNILGVGGAEYCANAAAMSAIPSSRRFIGKLAYRADNDVVYRWVGAGNTVQGGSFGWQAYAKPPTSFTPLWTSVSPAAPTVNIGKYGISDGRFWMDVLAAWSSQTPVFTAGTDVAVDTPGSVANTIAAGLINGTGMHLAGGSTAGSGDSMLTVFVPNGGSTSQVRVRAVAPLAATYTGGQPVRANMLGNSITGTASDTIMFTASGPAAWAG